MSSVNSYANGFFQSDIDTYSIRGGTLAKFRTLQKGTGNSLMKVTYTGFNPTANAQTSLTGRAFANYNFVPTILDAEANGLIMAPYAFRFLDLLNGAPAGIQAFSTGDFRDLFNNGQGLPTQQQQPQMSQQQLAAQQQQQLQAQQQQMLMAQQQQQQGFFPQQQQFMPQQFAPQQFAGVPQQFAPQQQGFFPQQGGFAPQFFG